MLSYEEAIEDVATQIIENVDIQSSYRYAAVMTISAIYGKHRAEVFDDIGDVQKSRENITKEKRMEESRASNLDRQEANRIKKLTK